MTTPVITTDPVSRTDVLPAEQVMFTVAATGEALTYQWEKDDVNIDDSDFYSGTDTAILTVVAAREPEDEGEYACIVGNPVGLETSAPATLGISELI